MAALSISSLQPKYLSYNAYYFNNHIFNNNTNNNHNFNLQSLPCSHHFPALSSFFTQPKYEIQFKCPSSKLSQILTHSSIPDKFLTFRLWLSYGLHLCRLFQLNELHLTEPQKARFYHYYIPVFLWCEDKISKYMSQFKDGEDIPPLVIGFSAPQGCGRLLIKSATLSIDYFCLTAEGQAKLREENPGNAHDLSFSIESLTAPRKLTKQGKDFFLLSSFAFYARIMKLPRYDNYSSLQSAYSGRGDRADPSMWPEVEGPLTVVLFEGWMLGFKPLPIEVVGALETVNKNLEAYYDAWDKFINAWIVIKIQDSSCVYQWHLQAGKPGMTDDEDFVSRYLPAHRAYLPTLYAERPSGSDPENVLLFEIDEGRNPILGD
ncbi:hypothetical protein P3X46_010932 [Hevea brasiliensis]|uniref:Uncharacterized protein n=1 Tax=Hevea brasiliensis TaxID=3981 RepID=A0ABQ9MJP3_HEVBR|nr:hypothetical protein P3X46_010932 [Hevea brasiliensis]